VIEIGRTYKGWYRRKKASRVVELVAHGKVYFIDKCYPIEHQIVEKCSKRAFLAWLRKNPQVQTLVFE